MCEYSCMEKHNNNEQDEQMCNVCQKIFSTSIEVLKHVASEHLGKKDPVDYKDKRKSSLDNQKDASSKEEEVGRDTSFVLTSSC